MVGDRIRVLVPVLVIAGLLAAALASIAGADAQSDYDTGYALGTETYEYGVPLLDTRRAYRTATSVSRPDTAAHAPVNRFSHAAGLARPEDRDVVAPNHDTLYSMAWLNLAHQPQVIHVPRIRDRFFALELLSPWTENFANISSVTGDARGGDFAIVGPGFEGRLPDGVSKIRSPYDRVWVIGRTLVRDEADVEAVNRIQRKYRITPLSKLGTGYRPSESKPLDTTVDEATIPGLAEGDDPLSFYTALGRDLVRFEPPAADDPMLEKLAAIGVGPGLDPAADASLSADTLRGMRDAVRDGPDNVQTKLVSMYVASAGLHNGYLIGDVGHYGTDYELRAIVDKVGFGALKPKIALYPFAQTSRDLAPLTGEERYVLHIPESQLPVPARAFWSLSLYDEEMYFFANPFERYVLNDRSDLHYNADGSLDLYVQQQEPSDPDQARNWLPAPSGGFRLMWRLYDTRGATESILDGSGWQPPPILACDASGVASDGTRCAS